MSSLELNNSYEVGFKYFNGIEAQRKGFKTAFMIMMEVLKEEIDESSKKSVKTQIISRRK